MANHTRRDVKAPPGFDEAWERIYGRGPLTARKENFAAFFAAGVEYARRAFAELHPSYESAERAVQQRWAGHERTAVDIHEDGLKGERPAWIPRGIE